MVDHICILDFEATCWENNKEHEIIEFPSILWRWDSKGFHRISDIQIFVKPKINPVVSKFCHNLTGITQQQVDNGVTLEEALKLHKEWLEKHANLDRTLIVTCGHWDIKNMLPNDLKLNNLKHPHSVYKRYSDIKVIFKDIMNTRSRKGMTGMLSILSLKLEGRHHSGIDDCHNISRIFAKLIKKGLKRRDIKRYICVI
jgi:inhibitor of KinA sporulation pathway (predicted exonuclease)